ncbi:ATP-dependent DNA helicase DinG [Oryzisolibacter propanilivorax]|uniref:ATP-dependent DNA helicase DinG n=1 Tax=Oryzisolibacter propanilivorax TaxID=1527607 RepID=A0A1G9QIT4_9BURK|nr:ATP-dependent DNA helicase DinG [Oryzisolibacter propanilivorax]SDM10932.1 ATP-dependent DNA helicase DinG [Oryzisolibacter propanilivorax]
MSTQQWADAALASFETVVQATAGFRVRDGQRRMAEQVAQTFAAAELGKAEDEDAEPQRAIAVIQAGTGVGKSLAYSAPAIALALARGTRVLISTATVALQEQLVHKDLPALAQHLEQPVRFALAKGRGRYVCKLKLERLAGGGAEDDEDWSGTDDLFGATESPQPAVRQAAQSRVQFYASMADALASGQWDGDRDTLATPPEAEAWSPVAAEAHSCTGKHCPLFSRCTYYERRKDLVAAQVIVANHDLLLSSIGARLLPELDNCLLIVDEAHHLPGTALSQFACEADLSHLGWIDKLASRALRIGQLVEVGEIADIPNHAARLRAALQDAARLAMDLYGAGLKAAPRFGSSAGQPTRARVPGGALPEALIEPFSQAAHHAEGFLTALRAIAKALRAAMRDTPDEARRLSQLYAQVGALAPRLEGVHACAQLLLQDAPEGAVPAAKWFTLAVDGDFVTIRAHASPVLPGNALRQHLWSSVRGAVLTSATLTSCGQFDFFLREAGLAGDDAVATLAVASPFDYALQGTLVARETRAEPRDVQQFTAQMVEALLTDLSAVEAGALVLFTSREQMRRAVDELPTHLRGTVLVQGQLPRRELLARHRERVAAGQPSIVFGMQSFGEGLDLPGALCESLFITKLPFAPPDDPVGEARAEWLRAAGRDPFSELVVPATAIRLAQWVGRAIRTEDDRAHVYCYDKRLVRTGYGQRLLSGLPPFTLQRQLAA